MDAVRHRDDSAHPSRWPLVYVAAAPAVAVDGGAVVVAACALQIGGQMWPRRLLQMDDGAPSGMA